MNTNPIKHLENVINNTAHGLQFQINALVRTLEQVHPGFTEAFRKQAFYEKCMSAMVGSAQLRARPDADALERLKANNGLIELLKKEAEAQGLMEVFEKAQRQAEHMGKEMLGKGQDVSIRIVPD